MGLCANDLTFGPAASCRNLDFTLYFTNLFLAFVPAVVLCVLTIPILFDLRRTARTVLPFTQQRWSSRALLASRAALATSLVAIEIARCVAYRTQQSLSLDWTGLAAGILNVVSATVLGFRVLLEHSTRPRPSTTPALYLLVSCLFCATQLRTIALIGLYPTLEGLIAASLGVRVGFFLALQISNRSALLDPDVPPSATAGLVELYLVAWVLPVLWRGYRKPLDYPDLGAIDEGLHSKATYDAFGPKWYKYRSRGRSQPLLRACVAAFAPVILAPVFPSLVYAVVGTARPLILLHTVQFAESFATPASEPLSHGWGLVGAAFLTYTIFALATAISGVAVQRSALAIRGALMEAIYRKALLIHAETAREMGAAKASNLMSVDVNNVITQLPSIHMGYTALTSTGLGLYVIWTQIGISFLAAVISAVIFFAVLFPLAHGVGPGRKIWGETTDRRVKFMSSVIRHIKAVKLSAYEPTMIRKLDLLRHNEIVALVKWTKAILRVSILTNWLGNWIAVTTVITYTAVSINTTTSAAAVPTAKIFAVISTIQLISEPLLMLGQSWGSLVGAWASFKRIEQFLQAPERQPRVPGRMSEVVMDKASFGVSGGVALIEEADIRVKPELWMIIGRVGSGKSVLLQALLGELDLLSGTATMQLGTVGYCAQDAWLRNASSVRENVVYASAYEPRWYHKVMAAVALDRDMRDLPLGDKTAVGQLSGGQKQRVSLARAIYGRFDTYVLDDVFSALDADTEARVFNALFGPQGLLTEKPVILATNQVYRLSHASVITVLKSGRIVEQGQYSDLMARQGETAALVTEFSAGHKDKTIDTAMSSKVIQEPQSEAGSHMSSMQDDDGMEVKKRGSTSWSTYRLYLKGMGYFSSGIWVGSVFLTSAFNTTISIYLQAWTTKLVNVPTSAYIAFLGGYAGMQIGFLCIFTGAIFYAFVYSHPISSYRLHEWQIRGFLRTSLSFAESHTAGQLMNRFNSDLNTIDFELPNAAVNFFYGATTAGFGFILMAVAGPYMIAVIVVTLGVMIVVQRFYVRAARELRRLDLTAKSPIYDLFGETMDSNGLCTIRAMQTEEACREFNSTRATASQHPAWLLFAVQKWLELALNLCVMIINTALVLIAVVTRRSISIGILAVAMSQAANLSLALQMIIMEWTKVEVAITSVERVQEFIELPPQDPSVSADPSWLDRGSIRFDRVSARYRPDLPPSISDVSFVVKAGQKVGICGRSGSGKSTLLGVLWRLIEQDAETGPGDVIQGGGIYVDGKEIRNLPLSDYRSAMSIIPQDPLLLEATMRENLDPEDVCSEAQIWAALEAAELKGIVNDLDEMMNADGGNLSRGQRQLLALARAILRRRKILALDEATSSIDVETDAAIQRTIRDAFDKCTVLTIAHRISTVIDYDVVIVMESGRIVEMGPPADLLSNFEGIFRKLALESGLVT